MSVAGYLTLSTVSRYFVKNSSEDLLLVNVHLMAGDILNALDIFVKIAEKNEISKTLEDFNSTISLNTNSNTLTSSLLKNSTISSTSLTAVSPSRLKSGINLT